MLITKFIGGFLCALAGGLCAVHAKTGKEACKLVTLVLIGETGMFLLSN